LIDKEGNALLTDFGLARIHDASISLTGSALIGTPAYMSPEQARGETVDARSDQYSLGVILYLLSTGTLPFEAETPMAVLIKQMHEPIPLPRSASAQVPEAVERVILKATAKDPGHRFGSVAELNEVFQAALAHARAPKSHPAPSIELPPEVQRTHEQPTVLIRDRWVRRSAVGVALLFLLLACPVSASGLRGLIDRASSPAESSGLVDPELNAYQLTALAGTIEAMSTELAVAQGGSISANEVQTAVMQTLAVSESIEEIQPTPTPEPGIGAGPSRTAIPQASDAPAPTATVGSMPSGTPTSETSTSTPTSATSTSIPTSASSPTLTQAPTDTPMAPSSTPSATPSVSADVCSTSSLGGFSISGKNVIWTLNNGASTTIEITETIINWPGSNDELLKVYLGGSLIWDETDGSPPTTLGSDWEGGSRVLNPGEGKPLKFEFDANAAASGYSLTVTLNGECELFAGG
jgi:serine/threonine protein kinase